MQYQKNVWYVAALSAEISRDIKRRPILGDFIAFYRLGDGSPVALRDRCPHRFAPLSRGSLVGDDVECRYHGLRFDASGKCALNPHGKIIPPHMVVRAYPVVERHGFVWIWPGDPALAEPKLIPDLSYMELTNEARTGYNYMEANYRYDILVDNLLDLSHADYLHDGTFSHGPFERGETTVRQANDDVIVRRVQYDGPALPGYPDSNARIDAEYITHWRPGQVMTFETRLVPVGHPFSEASVTRFCHIATPALTDKTHYFVNIEMEGKELMDLRPAILPTDVGSLHVRRVMKALIEREGGSATGASVGQ